MGSIFSLLGIARDGLTAQTAGLDATGQNISNVNTPGYVRRGAQIFARAVGPGNEGGVDVGMTLRSFDRFTYSRVVSEQSKQGSAQARSSILGQVESIMAPGDHDIGSRVDDLMAAFNTLSAFPMDDAARGAVLSKAHSVAESISGTASALSTTRGELFTKAQSIGSEVNEKLVQIAALNNKITEAQGRGDGAVDLRDQRDLLVRDVGDRIGAKSIEDARGSVTLFAAGTALVDGNSASPIDVSIDGAGALKVQVQRPGGNAIDVTTSVTEGSLGGLREARDTDIPKMERALDQFAFDLAGAINGVHSTGFGQDGGTGRAIFQTTAAVTGAAYALKIDPAIAGRPDRIAASATATDLPGGNQVAVQIAQLASSPLGAGGKTPGQRFGAMLGDIGSMRSAADSEREMRQDTVALATNLHESASGVSLDEEMVNMTRYQRAFEASTRVLRTADELLSNLIRDL